jgi:hypothetical protein
MVYRRLAEAQIEMTVDKLQGLAIRRWSYPWFRNVCNKCRRC